MGIQEDVAVKQQQQEDEEWDGPQPANNNPRPIPAWLPPHWAFYTPESVLRMVEALPPGVEVCPRMLLGSGNGLPAGPPPRGAARTLGEGVTAHVYTAEVEVPGQGVRMLRAVRPLDLPEERDSMFTDGAGTAAISGDLLNDVVASALVTHIVTGRRGWPHFVRTDGYELHRAHEDHRGGDDYRVSSALEICHGGNLLELVGRVTAAVPRRRGSSSCPRWQSGGPGEQLIVAALQVLLTVDAAQGAYGFMHNDLHLGNVLLAGEAETFGATVGHFTHLHYRTRGGLDVYLPRTRYAAKLCDFTYTEMRHGTTRMRLTRPGMKDQRWHEPGCDPNEPIFVGRFSPHYDVVYFLTRLEAAVKRAGSELAGSVGRAVASLAAAAGGYDLLTAYGKRPSPAALAVLDAHPDLIESPADAAIRILAGECAVAGGLRDMLVHPGAVRAVRVLEVGLPAATTRRRCSSA